MTVATTVSCDERAALAHRDARGSASMWSPSTTAPVASTARQRSASPSKATPASAPCSSTAARRSSEVRGAAVVVDVQAVGRGVDLDDLGAGAAQRLGADVRRGTVGAVDDDAQTVEPVRQRGEQVLDVHLGALGVVGDATDARAGRAGPLLAQARLDRVLDVVGQLVTAAGEELDAVVGHRVVRRRQHDAEVGVERGGQERDRRRRQHADAPHVDAGRQQPGHDGGLEELAARAAVAGRPRRPVAARRARRRRRRRRARARRPRRGRARARRSGRRWRGRVRRRCRTVDPQCCSRPPARGARSPHMPMPRSVAPGHRAVSRQRARARGPLSACEYWGALRAFLRPYFLRSLTRASRVRKPAFFSAGR